MSLCNDAQLQRFYDLDSGGILVEVQRGPIRTGYFRSKEPTEAQVTEVVQMRAGLSLEHLVLQTITLATSHPILLLRVREKEEHLQKAERKRRGSALSYAVKKRARPEDREDPADGHGDMVEQAMSKLGKIMPRPMDRSVVLAKKDIGQVVPMPSDGNCLFAALAVGYKAA